MIRMMIRMLETALLKVPILPGLGGVYHHSKHSVMILLVPGENIKLTKF